MPNKQLLDYIKSEIDRGESKENIKQRLLAQGWREEDVEEALGENNNTNKTRDEQLSTNTLVVPYVKWVRISGIIFVLIKLLLMFANKEFDPTIILLTWTAFAVWKFPVYKLGRDRFFIYSLVGAKKSYPSSILLVKNNKLYRRAKSGKEKKILGKMITDKKMYQELLSLVSRTQM